MQNQLANILKEIMENINRLTSYHNLYKSKETKLRGISSNKTIK